MCADREMARSLHASDDTDKETELGLIFNNDLCNNINHLPSEDLFHSDDECLKSKSIHVPTSPDAPTSVPEQLKDDAVCDTPTKGIVKSMKIILCP